MSSGIYKLTFPSGKFYIGKSNNIKRRWDEHFNKFIKGKAALNMQNEFNRYGHPQAKIILSCHEDHIDIMESYFINKYWGEGILNGVKPSAISELDYNRIMKYPDVLNFSTAEHCQFISQKVDEIEALKSEIEELEMLHEAELEAIKSGTKIPELEQNIYMYKDILSVLDNKIKTLRNRGLLARIFNW